MADPARKPPRLVRDLAQVRALSDPRKLSLLQAFAAAPTTILEVAARLRRPPTGLYRHVHLLTRLGLLRVVGERRKRGTVERTYLAVARAFEVDPSVFDAAGASDQVGAVFREAERGFRAACPPDRHATGPLAPTLASIRISGTPAEIARFRRRLVALAKAVAPGPAATRGRAATVTAGALLAFFPIDPVDR